MNRSPSSVATFHAFSASRLSACQPNCTAVDHHQGRLKHTCTLRRDRIQFPTWDRRYSTHKLVLAPVFSSQHRLRPPPMLRLRQARHQCLDQARNFHDYFVTHLPSSSLHPDSRTSAGPRHNLPRSESRPLDQAPARSPASMIGLTRETTVVRIPLKSAKHHYGAFTARGTRPYNEDTFQAGTIELPAFAKRQPLSLRSGADGEVISAGGASGDPQVFYFGVFDGHGGDVCSIWLREKLHFYIEATASKFEMESSLQKSSASKSISSSAGASCEANDLTGKREQLAEEEDAEINVESTENDADSLQKELVESWKDTVGGYFQRFQPEYFSPSGGGQGDVLQASAVRNNNLEVPSTPSSTDETNSSTASLESVLSYSFLKADLDFVTGKNPVQIPGPPPHDTNPAATVAAAAAPPPKPDSEEPSKQDFIGGSTCSIALISTPSSIPFWHPSTPFTIATGHLGDTRILLCSTSSGAPVPLTATHHPSTPAEAARLRRYAGAFTTDSFGEERLTGLANTRAFGDRRSKRVGVSAEPQLSLLHARPGEFSFMVLVSDGITGVLSDREIVDVVKECRTPADGAKAVVNLATELGAGEKGDADNATALVVRMGGWERRTEGGKGSLETKEARDTRKMEANDPRRGRN